MKLLINLCAHDGIISHYTGVGTIVNRYIQTFNYILSKMSNIEYKLNLITPEYNKDSFGYSYIYDKNHNNIKNSKIIQISNGSNGKVNYGTITDWKELCENAKEYINNLNFKTFKSTLRENKTMHASAPEDGIPVILKKPSGNTQKLVKQELEDLLKEFIERLGI